MDRSRLCPQLSFLLSVCLTLLSAALRTAAMLTHFDAEVGYLDGTALPVICRVLYAAAVLLPLVSTLCTPKGALPAVSEDPRSLASLLPLIGSLFFGVVMLIRMADGTTPRSGLPLVLTIGAFLNAVFFLLTMLKVLKNKDLLALIGFLPVFWCILAVAEAYNDPFTTMNSPVKLSLQFGLIGFMLAMTAELRVLLAHSQPRAFLYLHGLSLFLCATGSVPYLVAMSRGILSDLMHPLYAVFLLGAALFSLIRLCRFMMVDAAPAQDAEQAPADADVQADEAPAGTDPAA